jgi:hypothetical protein
LYDPPSPSPDRRDRARRSLVGAEDGEDVGAVSRRQFGTRDGQRGLDLVDGEADGEGGPETLGRLDGDGALEAIDELLADGKAEAGAGVSAGQARVGLGEGLEDVRKVFRTNADARIADDEDEGLLCI